MSPASRAVEAFWRAAAFPFREVRSDDELHYRRARWLLRAFYVWVLLFVIFYGLDKTEFHLVPHDDPLWPVIWMSWLPWELGVYAVTGACLVGAILAAVQPHWRWTRIWAFLGLFQFLALWYTYTGVQHRTYTMLTLSFFFALLPRVPDAGSERGEAVGRYLDLLWGGVAFVLLAYSMAGLLKVEGIVQALARGDERLLDFGAVPVHLLKRAFKFENPPVLAEFVLNNPGLATLGFFSVVYVEFCSLAAAFRPNLQRYWFAILAGFHFSTEWTMRIFFVPATVVLLLLTVFSPFSRPWRDWRAALRELPWFGPLLATLAFKLVPARDTETVVYHDASSALSERWVQRLRGRPAATGRRIDFVEQRDPRYADLVKRKPYLGDHRGLVVYSREGGLESVRLRAEGVLWAAAHFRGAIGWLFAALVIPPSLLNLGYRMQSRRLGAASALLLAALLGSPR